MKKTAKRRVWLVIGVCCVAGLLLEAGLLIAVVRSESSYPEPQPADAIIVLGAKVNPDGQPSNVLTYRLDEAARLYREGLAKNIIVCGGQGKDEPASEAETMAAYLAAQGIPESAIFPEAASRNTQENLLNAQAIMLDHGWNQSIVVTTNYHVRRALWLCGDLGIQAQGVPAISSHIPFVKWRLRVQETLSWIKYYITR